MVLQYVSWQSVTARVFYNMFCSWGTRPAEVPKGDRGRSGRKVADPNTTHNRKVVHFGGVSGRQPGKESGTVARGGPERPPRRPTTPSKSTRSSRLSSVSSSSPLSPSVLLRDVVVGKMSFLRPKVGVVFFVSRGRIRKLYLDLWTFSPDPVTSSVVAAVER